MKMDPSENGVAEVGVGASGSRQEGTRAEISSKD
jgi:hypothetical protein